jgi:hypothetical protein
MPTAVFTPNISSRLTAERYASSDNAYYALATYNLPENAHSTLFLMRDAGKNEDLTRKDSDLSLCRVGHHGVYLRENDPLYSPDLTKMTTHTDQIRRRGRAVLFSCGSRFPRDECWTLCLTPRISNLRTTYRRVPDAQPITTSITRDGNPCSVCLDELDGRLATCPNGHQIHRQCYTGLDHHRRRCPECRAGYSLDEINALAELPDRTLLHKRLIYPNHTRRDADLRFVGLCRRFYGGGANLSLIAYLDSLDYYLRTPRPDYLLNADEQGVPFFDGFDRPAWVAFHDYYRSRENLDRLKERDLTPNTYNATYDEVSFFADLLTAYPADARERLARAITEQEKASLRRDVWVEHRLLTYPTHQSFATLITGFINRPASYSCVRLTCDEVVI